MAIKITISIYCLIIFICHRLFSPHLFLLLWFDKKNHLCKYHNKKINQIKSTVVIYIHTSINTSNQTQFFAPLSRVKKKSHMHAKNLNIELMCQKLRNVCFCAWNRSDQIWSDREILLYVNIWIEWICNMIDDPFFLSLSTLTCQIKFQSTSTICKWFNNNCRVATREKKIR